MTNTKCKFGAKAFVLIILTVVFLVCVFSPFALVSAAATDENTEDANLFVGHSDGSIDIHEATRLTSPSSDAPSLTVLVHGQGGRASHWSNNGAGAFTYDSSSLIESLRFTAQDAEVYLADVKGNYENPEKLDEMIPSDDFYLIRIMPNDYTIDQKDYVTKLSDVSKHIIVVFESSIPYSYHQDVYNELHNVIDRISYDILYLTGKIPKVNLISHSRGGIISMMYATGYRSYSKTAQVKYVEDVNGNLIEDESYTYIPNGGDIIYDHPFNVSEIYNMGTPYWGTDWDTRFFGIAHTLLGEGTFNCPSAKNILDETIQEEIHSCWENAITINPQLEMHAIAGEIKSNFLPGLIAEEYALIAKYIDIENSLDEINALLQLLEENNQTINELITTVENATIGIAVGTTVLFAFKGLAVSVTVGSSVIATLETARCLTNTVNNKISEIKTTLSNGDDLNLNSESIFALVADILKEITDLCDVVDEVLGFIENDDTYSLIGDWGDLFIDRNSQLAANYLNVNRYIKVFEYDNLEFEAIDGQYKLISSEKNFEYKKNISDVGIPHNLETRDAEIIEYITNNITLGVPSNILEYEENSDGTITIINCELPSYYNNAPWSNIKLNLNLSQGICGFNISAIANNAFDNLDNLESIILSSTITSIGTNAFTGCTSLESINIPSNVTSIGDGAFSGCSSLTNITIPAGVTSIGKGVFVGCNNLNINVSSSNLNYSSQDNILYNNEKTVIVGTGKVLNNVIIPDTVTTILPYAFKNNSNIDTVRFNNSVTIGDNAFNNCSELSYVYYYSNNIPLLGVDSFSNNEFILYVPYNNISQYEEIFNAYTNTITSKDYIISFNCNETPLTPIITCYGKTLDGLPTPVVSGYTFENWYDNELCQGEPYLNGDVWTCEENKTLYAKLIPNQYTVELDSNGGTLTGGNQITVVYGEVFYINTTANKEHYVLEGWYDENGVKYADSNGEGVILWDKTDNTILIAGWTAESYEVRVNDDGSIVWLGISGFTDESCSIVYGTVLNANELVSLFKNSNHGYKEGKIFDHFEIYGSNLNWTWDTVPDLGDNGDIINIVPVWVLENHTIKFETSCNINVSNISCNYGTDIILPSLSRPGYIFGGWRTSSNSTATAVNWVKMPDLTGNLQSNGTITLYAKWTAITYYISYDANDGTGAMTQSKHTYDDGKALNKNTFTRQFYSFIGWATTNNGEVVYEDEDIVLNLTNINNYTVTLYAKWDPIKYDINYQNLVFMDRTARVITDGYINNLATTVYTSATGLDLSNITAYMPPSGTSTSGPDLVFMGWYSNMNFTKKIESISATQTGTVTLYAKWRVDFSYGIRNGSRTVTNAGQMSQSYDRIYIGLGTSGTKQALKNIGINEIDILIRIHMWRIDDKGTQYIYLYGDSSDSKLMATITCNVNNNKQEKPEDINIYFDIDSLYEQDYIYIRYNASTSGIWPFRTSNDWANDLIYYEVMYLVDPNDKNYPDFTYDYADPFV
ncbi:MAG: InlB B-repeat-containing protein [Clostridia bacterium]|nr:InlB B-repeat-containing protein [Clostridia bacterium]